MSSEEIEITVKTKDGEFKFTGDAKKVTSSFLDFLWKTYPQLDLISRVSMTTDVKELLQQCEGVFAVTPEGVVVTCPTDNLADRDLILLHLAKAYFANIVGKSRSDSVMLSDIINAIRKPAGTVAGRFSELSLEEMVLRVGKGEYRITTLGLSHFLKSIVPKLKEVAK